MPTGLTFAKKTTAAQAGGPNVAIKTAARYLGISGPIVEKGLESGVLPNLRLSVIDELSSRSVITEARSATGAKLPILRTRVFRGDESGDPTNFHPAREGHGYKMGMTALQLHGAASRWWRPQDSEQAILDAGALVVVCASFVVGFLDIHGKEETDQETGQIAYKARIVAYSTDVYGDSHDVVHSDEGDSPNLELAEAMMNRRILGGGGTSINTKMGK